MPPGAVEQRHRPALARQFFYVLDYEAAMELEGARHGLDRGVGLHVPPGAAHRMSNEGRGNMRFLVVPAPKIHGNHIDGPYEAES